MRDDHTAHVALWRARIAQMLADATATRISGYAKASWPIVRGDAQRWFQKPADDFEPTCISAELNPASVRAFAMLKIDAFNARAGS